MDKVVLIGLGGFLGAVARFGVSQWIRTFWGSTLPLATLVVNVVGCFTLGIFLSYFRRHDLSPTLSLFVIVGILGSFTTFSAFSWDTLQLIRNGETFYALLNVGGNLLLCFAAILVGEHVASLI